MSNEQHGATLLAKREELYQRCITNAKRQDTPTLRNAFYIAWEAKNNYDAIEALWRSILIDVIDPLFDGVYAGADKEA